MQNPPNPSGGFSSFWLLILASIIGIAVYLELSYPAHLKHIQPEKFESHPARDLRPFFRDFRELNPVFFNETFVGICEDVQIGSHGKAFCVNHKNDVIMFDMEQQKAEIIGKIPDGHSFGIRLSKDEKLLYIINDKMGLIEFNFETGKTTTLVNKYKGEFLISLDAVEIHPKNPDILFITQASDTISLDFYILDIMLNNPFGRVFEFNKKTNDLSLLADGLYFANGIVFQTYKNQETLLVSETNRFRLTRIYLSGQNRGKKQIVVDKLDIFVDNVKLNQKGEVWVAGPTARDPLLEYADHNPWLRRIMTRLPFWLMQIIADPKHFGGVKITFSEDQESYQVEYFLWEKLWGFNFGTTLNEKNDSLFVSSLHKPGVWYVPKFNEKIERIKKQEKGNKQTAEQL